jgi:DNA-binding response OmpR family regulator
VASILIIDDDVTLLARLGAQLEAAGFEVARSSDLRHAEGLYAEQRPDLVLLEVRTGNDGGWELLGRLAAETPVLVLSAAAHEEDVVRGIEAGAADYLPKPYRTAELLARLRARLAVPEPALVAQSAALPESPPAHPATTTTAHLAPRRARKRPEEEEPVFMSEAEEMALLRMPPPADAKAAPAAAGDEPSQSFGPRLRAERLRRHITLVQIENDLRIRMSNLQALEDEKFTLLPRGPAGLQMVRSYAEYLGLNATAMLEEFRSQHYVESSEPLPALGGSRMPRSLPRWLVPLLAVILALAVGIGAILLLDPAFFQALWAQLLGLLG